MNDTAVACGAFNAFSEDTVEIKRMYTDPLNRGSGLASKILSEIEEWAKESNYKKCVLETGTKQPEAIALYEKSGYYRIPNYGPYIDVDKSVCYEKIL